MKIDIALKYSSYLSEIDYIMHNLEQGRIYEKTGWTQDGYLATNITKLRSELNSMLYAIQKDELGIESPNEKVLRSYNDK